MSSSISPLYYTDPKTSYRNLARTFFNTPANTVFTDPLRKPTPFRVTNDRRVTFESVREHLDARRRAESRRASPLPIVGVSITYHLCKRALDATTATVTAKKSTVLLESSRAFEERCEVRPVLIVVTLLCSTRI